MAKEIDFKNERISNSEGLLTLTLDWVMSTEHPSTSTYTPYFTEIAQIFCGRSWMDGH